MNRATSIEDKGAIVKTAKKDFILDGLLLLGIVVVGYFATVTVWSIDQQFAPQTTYLKGELNETFN